jgi:hypothetical protein
VEVNLDAPISFPLRKPDHCKSSIDQIGVPFSNSNVLHGKYNLAHRRVRNTMGESVIEKRNEQTIRVFDNNITPLADALTQPDRKATHAHLCRRPPKPTSRIEEDLAYSGIGLDLGFPVLHDHAICSAMVNRSMPQTRLVRGGTAF